MTISQTKISSGPYSASAQTTFAVDFQSAGPGEITVTLNDVTVSPSAYTFYRDADGTGSVIFNTAVTGTVRIISNPAFDQQIGFNRFGAFYPDQINQALDRAAARDLVIRDKADRAFKVPVGETAPALPSAASRAGKILSFDSSGNPKAAGVVELPEFIGPSGTVSANGLAFVTPQQFGAVADDIDGAASPTDNLAAFKAVIAHLETLAVDAFPGDKDRQVLPTLHIPPGLYYCSDTLELKVGQFNIEAHGARIRFPANKHGMIIHAFNTIGERIHDTTVDGPHKRASGTKITGLHLTSGGGTDAFKHGFYIRTGVVLRGCVATNFPGNGCHIAADVAGDARGMGNANLFRLENSTFSHNGANGVFCDFGDANAGIGIGLDCSYNGRWGIWDSSFLGNTWIGCHTDSNGLLVQSGPSSNPTSVPTLIRHNNNIWGVRIGRETDARTIEPGTDPAVWYLLYGPEVKRTENADWVSGMELTSGGSYAADDANARATFIGNYEEGTQAASQVYSPSIIVGGFQGNAGTGGPLQTIGGKVIAPAMGSRTFHSTGEALFSYTGGGGSEGRVFTAVSEKYFPGVEGWRWNVTADGFEMHQHGAGGPVYRVTHNNTTLTFGRATPLKHAFQIPTLVIGDRLHSTIGALTDLDGAEVAQGDVFYNRAPAAGGFVGWVCTTGGVGGTTAVFKTFGAISA